MTKLLEQAVETVRGLPPEVQDDLARILLQLAGQDQPVVELSVAEKASFEESLAQADRGEFATDEQLRAIWAKHSREIALYPSRGGRAIKYWTILRRGRRRVPVTCRRGSRLSSICCCSILAPAGLPAKAACGE